MPYQNQNQFERYPIQSNSVAFFSTDSMLRANFSDSLLNFQIRDVVVDENGKRTFPRVQGEKGGYATLTQSRAVIFLKRIKDTFIPKFKEYLNAYEEDKSFDKMVSVGVILNKDATSVLSLTSGRPDPKKGYCPSLQICTNLASETRIPETVKTFTFTEKIPVVTDYDPVTGNFATCEDDAPQLIIFIHLLEQFIKAATCAEAHFVNVELREKINDINKIVTQIAESNGIVVPSRSYSYGNSGGSRSMFNPANGNDADTPAPSLKQFDANLAEFENDGDQPF